MERLPLGREPLVQEVCVHMSIVFMLGFVVVISIWRRIDVRVAGENIGKPAFDEDKQVNPLLQ